jgi:hypothetical protein
MRDLIVREMLPYMATTSLFVLLSLLTWLGWRSKRGSALHRLRLWVLTALVMISGGAAAGCGDRSQQGAGDDGTNNGQGANTNEDVMPSCYEVMPTCYAPMEPPPPANEPPPPMPTCYAPMEAPPPANEPPPPMPTCYAPMEAPPPSDERPPPMPTCYAPMRAPQPGSEGPQPSGLVTPDAGTTNPVEPSEPQIMCYRSSVRRENENI